MNLLKSASLPLLLTITVSSLLTGCDALTRSKFQNEYIRLCKAEAKFSMDRCECFAENMDADLTAKEKQMVLNPTDNPFGLMELMGPLRDISDRCVAEGR